MIMFLFFRKILFTLLLLLPLLNLPLPASALAPTLTFCNFADLVEPLLPAVVNISTTTHHRGLGERQFPLDIPLPKGSPLEEFFREFFERMQPESPRHLISLGSGFIIDAAGYVVTNDHLVADAHQITVTLNDNTELKATLIGRDRRTDIAILKIEHDKKLPFLQWGESEKLRIGDQVIAIGNPFGLGGTVTTGIVSYLARDIHQPGGFIEGYIQTDASINLGNSGGPMLDMTGKVVGINTAIYSPTGGNVGIGFAIPSEIAKNVVAQILQHGRTKRGWLGVSIQSITKEIGESLGLKDLNGALVSGVVKEGPAAKAKLQAGDIILKVDNKDVKDSRSLPRIVGDLPVGSQTSITIFRKGEILSVPIQIGEYEEAEEAGIIPSIEDDKKLARGVETHGMILQVLTEDIRKRFDIPGEIQGVLVANIKPTSPALERGIRPGDIIMEINQEKVKTPQHVIEVFKRAEKEKRKFVLLLINHNGEPHYVSIPLAPQ